MLGIMAYSMIMMVKKILSCIGGNFLRTWNPYNIYKPIVWSIFSRLLRSRFRTFLLENEEKIAEDFYLAPEKDRDDNFELINYFAKMQFDVSLTSISVSWRLKILVWTIRVYCLFAWCWCCCALAWVSIPHTTLCPALFEWVDLL